MLTPSKRKTVELRQSLDSFVKELARCVMNNFITCESVLKVVSAIQTSPSEDIAAMMLIFYDRTLSAEVFSIPRLFHRLRLKSATGIQLSSMLIIRCCCYKTCNIFWAYKLLRTLDLSELPAKGTRLIFL